MSYLKAKPSTPQGGQGQTRDPPPSLFLHPSREASHISLPGEGTTAAASAAAAANYQQKEKQPQQQQQQQPDPLSPSYVTAATSPTVASDGLGLTRTMTSTSTRTHHHQQYLPPALSPTVPRLQTGDSSRATDRTDALWAEMQATLEDVELSASGGTRVFGPDHDRALSDLRAAQISLAHAWARSEADDAIESGSSSVAGALADQPEVGNLKGKLSDVGLATAAANAGGVAGRSGAPGATGTAATTAGDHTDAGRNSAAGTATRPGSSGGGGGGGGVAAAIVGAGTSMGAGFAGEKLGARLEQETERDILHARRRREANDRYFSRVDQGVRDVVARLEEVAVAMRAVEQETRDVWGDDSSAPASVKT